MGTHFLTRIAVGRRPGEPSLGRRRLGSRGWFLALGYGFGNWLGHRLALVEPHLEGAPKILAGDLQIEARPPRLEFDHAHTVVTLTVASGVALGLVQRP